MNVLYILFSEFRLIVNIMCIGKCITVMFVYVYLFILCIIDKFTRINF